MEDFRGVFNEVYIAHYYLVAVSTFMCDVGVGAKGLRKEACEPSDISEGSSHGGYQLASFSS